MENTKLIRSTQGNIGATLGGNSSSNTPSTVANDRTSIASRLGDTPQRESNILVDQQIVRDTVVANTDATIANNQVTINAPNTATNQSLLLAGREIVLIGANSTTSGQTLIDKNSVTNAIGPIKLLVLADV